MAKPFVKWAGGKGKILPVIEKNLPSDFNEQQTITYIEPFVGGGAVLFFLLSKYQNIGRIIINDINPALINCYKQIKHHHLALIRELSKLQDAYYSLDNIEQKSDLYYSNRNEYNLIPVKKRSNINAAALFLFLNKNCFNGLYRENKQGKFNVPFGKHFHPTICDK